MALLKLVAANDTFGALVALGEVLAAKQAVFITAPEVNGKMPETFGLPDEVESGVGLIVETSGSSGKPKRVTLSREAILASANASQLRLGGPGQWLLALPINFVAGANVLIRSLVADTQPVLMNTSVPFTAEAFARSASLMNGARRYASVVPTQLARLAAAIDDPFSPSGKNDFLLAQLRKFDAILVGGQAPQDEVIDRLSALGVKIITTYGMTETCGGCVYDGVPLDGVKVDLVGNRIEISGKVLATEIADDSGVHQIGERYITNDLGEFDENGKLNVLGRIDRVIVSGGLKISLDRVEELARAVPGVAELAATAIADSEWGQRVGIVYLGSPEVADEIALALANDLGPAGKPVRVVRTDGVPKLPSGKHDLQAIRRLFEEL
ncbi:MAG: AMP-binding protein [Rhodoluna sp.]